MLAKQSSIVRVKLQLSHGTPALLVDQCGARLAGCEEIFIAPWPQRDQQWKYAVIPANEAFNGTFPYEPRFSQATGFRMHYVDAGPQDAPVVLCVHGELGYNILSTLKLNGFERHKLISEAWLRAYGSRYADPADCLGAIGWAKGYASGEHRFETPNADTTRQIRSKPVLAIWGMADRTLGAQHFLPLFEALFPAACIHQLQGVGHYSFEDAPETIAEIIGDFLAETALCPSACA